MTLTITDIEKFADPGFFFEGETDSVQFRTVEDAVRITTDDGVEHVFSFNHALDDEGCTTAEVVSVDRWVNGEYRDTFAAPGFAAFDNYDRIKQRVAVMCGWRAAS